MKRLLLLTLLVLPLLGAAPAKSAQLSVELAFLDYVSRAEVTRQKLSLSLDAKNAEHAIKGGAVDGWKARILAREVNVNKKAEGYWVEMTILDAKGAEAGDLAVILPQDPAAAFSAATKVKSEKSPLPINAVLTRSP